MTTEIVGIIEGFYGTPWSHADRLHVIDTISSWGWNTYVWAAKLEPRHRDKWEDPFTSEELVQFAELASRQTNVNCVIALTPGNTATSEQVVDKLHPAIRAGANSVVLCFDDLPVLKSAAQHRLIANAVYAELQVPVWITPTHYAGITTSPYLETLCNGLHENIEVMWTGKYVVCDTITAAQAQERVAATGGRRPLLWDNAPVNDAIMQHHLHLGPYTGRESALKDVCSGFLWNPMISARASLVMLESAAAWWHGDDHIDAWNTVVDRDGWRALAEATAYREDAHWPGDTPSREWWKAVVAMPDIDALCEPWIISARRGAQLALSALDVLDTNVAESTTEHIGALTRSFFGWSGYQTMPARTLGAGPRQRPIATQNSAGKFVLQPTSVAPSASLVDGLVSRALHHLGS